MRRYWMLASAAVIATMATPALADAPKPEALVADGAAEQADALLFYIRLSKKHGPIWRTALPVLQDGMSLTSRC